MKQLVTLTALILFLLFLAIRGFSSGPVNEPWTRQQLMEPTELAGILNNPKVSQPVILCTGIQAIIKNSIYIGPAGEKENLKKLRTAVEKLPKDTKIVLYCGCCPFDVCPNIRPAFRLLTEMGFKNSKLLNLSTNIKVDWIDHNYPISER